MYLFFAVVANKKSEHLTSFKKNILRACLCIVSVQFLCCVGGLGNVGNKWWRIHVKPHKRYDLSCIPFQDLNEYTY